jgi:hypothetical protein
MEQLIKKDPLTGEKFVAKRSNQRFATAENKIRYNNRKNAEINKERAFIDRPCKQSHLILKELHNPKSDNIYNRYFLEGKGLRFDAFNRIVDTKYGKLHAYYDYAIRMIPNSDNVQIIKL